MSRLRNKIFAAIAGTGSLLALAAQIKPEDAGSNLSAWYKLVVGLVSDVQPPKWLTYPVTDKWATYIGIMLFIAAAFGWYVSRNTNIKNNSPDTLDKRKIPISVSRLHLFACANKYVFYNEESESDSQLFSLGEVTISNVSLDRRVVLDLILIIRDPSDPSFKIASRADLIGPMGLKYGRNDLASIAAKKCGTDNRTFFECPIEIDPGNVTRKTLVFLFNIAWIPFKMNVARIMMNWPKYSFDLELRDLLTGDSVIVPIPSNREDACQR